MQGDKQIYTITIIFRNAFMHSFFVIMLKLILYHGIMIIKEYPVK